MGSRRAACVVSRSYAPAPEKCADALQLLLKSQTKQEGGPAQSRPGNDAKEIENVCAAEEKYTRT